MISFPNAKINLGLRVIRKRDDGYHDLDTVFYPLPLTDVLEVVPSDDTQLFSSGLTVESNPEHNLVWKAYQLLKKDYPPLPPVHLYLHKIIPFGAGLGGGSSDAAFALRLLNDMVPLNLTQEQLLQYALKLGSDCPFFILNKPAYAVSRGEQLQPIPLDLQKYFIALIKPDLHISTARAFSRIQPRLPDSTTKEIVSRPIQEWKRNLINDFEISAFEEFSSLKKIKEELYQCGALYASMSGSGSSFFGIFEERPELSKEFMKHEMFILDPVKG